MGHSGDSEEIPFVASTAPPANDKERLDVLKVKLHVHDIATRCSSLAIWFVCVATGIKVHSCTELSQQKLEDVKLAPCIAMYCYARNPKVHHHS